jgi:hypothetical protein|tara:strand:+ start:4019 stop:4354 length:336 start_codon:yes stop_codon:yes gene_type:complete
MANVYLNSKVDLTTTNDTLFYTCPFNSRAIVKSILVSEDTGSGTTINLTLTNAAGAVFNVFKLKAVGANTTIQLLTEPLVLMESEILKVQAADANELHVIATILEINREDS